MVPSGSTATDAGPATGTGGAAPLVYILMSNYNGKRWLDACLRSTFALDYPNFVVVVVDNGSSDGSAEYIRAHFPAVKLIAIARNRGYAGAMNVGLAYAAARGADYFLIMNNDIVVDRDALAALLETARREPAAGTVTGKVYFFDDPDTLQTVGKTADPVRLCGEQIGWHEKDEGQYDAVAERDYVDGVYCLVDRRLYDEVGGYDPGFYLQADELDWQIRAKAQGWRIYYTPGAKLWHRVSASTGGGGNPVSQYFFMRNSLIVVYRYGGWHRFARYYVSAGFASSFGLFKGLLQLKGKKIRPRLGLWLGFWGGTFWLFHRRPATGVPRPVRLLAG